MISGRRMSIPVPRKTRRQAASASRPSMRSCWSGSWSTTGKTRSCRRLHQTSLIHCSGCTSGGILTGIPLKKGWLPLCTPGNPGGTIHPCGTGRWIKLIYQRRCCLHTNGKIPHLQMQLNGRPMTIMTNMSISLSWQRSTAMTDLRSSRKVPFVSRTP